MPTNTPDYGLAKPLLDEFYDVNVFNANADKTDAALKGIATETKTKVSIPATSTQGNVVVFGADGQIVDSNVKLVQKANTPVMKNFTLLAANWSGNRYTLATGMFTGSNPMGDIGLAAGATEAQYAACAMASLSIVSASNGSIVLRANGTVPEVNLTVTVEVRT